MFGSGNFLKGSKGMNKMMKFMMMKEMFGGDKDSEFGNFSEMFDLDFDSDDETDDKNTDEAADEA